MRFGIVADDHTGATDAAGMLTERGVRTVLLLDWSSPTEVAAVVAPFQAIVLGAETRSVAPEAAFRRTAEGVDLLKAIGADQVQFKYCSTFDSTPRGNIGPSLDAAMERLGARGAVVCPALPVNGRLTFMGYHFVNGQLLSESPLRDHPLNPMTDSNLVRWLSQQTRRRVGLADFFTVRRGSDALRQSLDAQLAEGCSYVVTDAIEDRDLAMIAEATRDWPLASGGSGITAALADLHFPERRNRDAQVGQDGRQQRPTPTTHHPPPTTHLVIAGSCSPATRRQNEYAIRSGFHAIRLGGMAVLDGTADLSALAARVRVALADGGRVLLSASAGPAEVAEVQTHGRDLGFSVPEVGRRIADALAEIAARCFAVSQEADLTRGPCLIVSGGETAGAVCRRLGIRALEVGLPIEPGVPYCFPLDGPVDVTVLKSGNFGSEDFYLRVIDRIARI